MFFNSLGSLVIDCDAPAYAVVKACRTLGLSVCPISRLPAAHLRRIGYAKPTIPQ